MALQNISGITVTCTTTGQVAASDCAGDVQFHNPSGGAQSWSTAAGIGHRCTSGDDNSYAALSPASHAAGAVELTISPTAPFLVNSLVRTANSLLGGTTAPTGGTWHAGPNDLKETAAADGVQASNTGTGQINRCYNDVTPPQANYFAQITFKVPTIGSFHTPTLFIHFNTVGPNGYAVRYTGSTGNVTLLRVTAGGATTLGTAAAAGTGLHTMAIAYNSGSLEWWVDGTRQTDVADATYASAGLVALTDSNSSLPQDGPMSNIFAVAI